MKWGDRPLPELALAALAGLLAARGISSDVPPADPVARWARLAAQLCRSPAGFVAVGDNGHWQVTSHTPLTRMQQVTADAASRHVVAARRPGLFAGVRSLPVQNPPATGLIAIAVPIVMPYEYTAAGAIGVLDVTTENHTSNLEALTTLAEAYGWLTEGAP